MWPRVQAALDTCSSRRSIWHASLHLRYLYESWSGRLTPKSLLVQLPSKWDSTPERQMSPIQVYVIGPSSTGKTTLCNAVAKSVGLPTRCYITEVARQVMRSKGYTRADVGTVEMQRAIMLAQLEKEANAFACARWGNSEGELILSDRSGIDPIVYAIMTAKNEGEARQKEAMLVDIPAFQMALRRYKDAIFLLLNPVEEWLVDDGVRSLDHHEHCIKVFRQVLDKYGIKYQEIGAETKKIEDRVRLLEERMGLVHRPLVSQMRETPVIRPRSRTPAEK
ncbi:AAA domain-containing protein [Pisolithus sp. B1]|nr:AAA domain-containing protein [Pisolithus sp. B1]